MVILLAIDYNNDFQKPLEPNSKYSTYVGTTTVGGKKNCQSIQIETGKDHN